LGEVIDRLSRAAAVEGVLVIGSASDDRLTPASDYDLVVVLTELPQALAPYGVTYIDGRLTDLILVGAGQLEEIAELEEPVDGEAWSGRIIRWFQTGKIRHDRSGLLGRLQRQVHGRCWIEPPASSGWEAWREVNYNLAQSKRMYRSEDPVYLAAADLRLALYGPADLLFNYFRIRGIAWEGEKVAVRYLMARDATYLNLLNAFIQEGEREKKLALYEELVALTVAPWGEIWPEGVTVLALKEGDRSREEVDEALHLWEDLLAAGSGGER
jgi:predicted nucleotidyltransferase